MRVTVKRLKRLIREEASQMHEVDGDIGASLEPLIEPFLVEMGEAWDRQYDPSDPSMAHVGHGAWMAQCESALEELQLKVVEAVEEVERRLHAGEFYRG